MESLHNYHKICNIVALPAESTLQRPHVTFFDSALAFFVCVRGRSFELSDWQYYFVYVFMASLRMVEYIAWDIRSAQSRLYSHSSI